MALVLQIRGKFDPNADLPAEEKGEWLSELQAAQSKIYRNLTKMIATASDFDTKIATPSATNYKNFVNPNYEDADLITAKQEAKIKGAYSDWSTGVANAFGTGGYFADRVNTKSSKFNNKVRYGIGAVGFRPEGFGASIVVAGYLTGDITAKLNRPASVDIVAGTDDVISDLWTIPNKQMRSILTQIITQGLAIIQEVVDQGGDTTPVINAMNAKIDKVMNLYNSAVYQKPTATFGVDTSVTPNVAYIEVTVNNLV